MFRRRLRTFTIWTGATLCALIAAAFVASAWWACMVQLGPVAAFIMSGSVSVLHDDPFVNPIAFDQHSHGLSRWATLARSDSSDRWAYWVEFPILAEFAAVAVPTLLVWRLWPKPVRAGHCRCGYDLTGNTNGVCLECGLEARAQST